MFTPSCERADFTVAVIEKMTNLMNVVMSHQGVFFKLWSLSVFIVFSRTIYTLLDPFSTLALCWLDKALFKFFSKTRR